MCESTFLSVKCPEAKYGSRISVEKSVSELRAPNVKKMDCKGLTQNCEINR